MLSKPVSFEIAKLLKEKGFDVPVRNYRLEGKYSDFVYEGFEDDYWGDNKIVNWNKDIIGIKPFKGFVSAPTIAKVVDWCLEKHGVWITVRINGIDKMFGYSIHNINTMKGSLDNIERCGFTSPTEAYTKAIK